VKSLALQRLIASPHANRHVVGIGPAASAQPYQNCKAAAADGRYDIPSDDPAYGPWLDRDQDGIGCES
jgi:hypothetical protein